MSNSYTELIETKAAQLKEIFKDCDSTQVLHIMQAGCNELLDEAELDIFYENYDIREDVDTEDAVSVDDILPDDED